MFCKRCGKEISDEAVVCPYCGVQVGELSVAQSEEKAQTNGMAIAGFVCSFFIPLLGWIFGGIGLSKSKKCGGKGKRFSIAAIVIASVMFVIYLIGQL